MSSQIPTLARQLTDEVPVSPCDTVSVSFLCISMTLFVTGSLITLMSTEGSEMYLPTFNHLWYLGPFFLCCGLMVAFKALIHIRKKTLIEYLTRQAILAVNEESDPNYAFNHSTVNNNQNNMDAVSEHSLPPPYEAVIASQEYYPKKQYV